MIMYLKKTKKLKRKKYWFCQTSGCGAYVHTTIQDVGLKIIGEHNHLPHPESIGLETFPTKVKQRVMKETTPIIKIHEEEIVASQMSPQT